MVLEDGSFTSSPSEVTQQIIFEFTYQPEKVDPNLSDFLGIFNAVKPRRAC
jgi:hypothetical protein